MFAVLSIVVPAWTGRVVLGLVIDALSSFLVSCLSQRLVQELTLIYLSIVLTTIVSILYSSRLIWMQRIKRRVVRKRSKL